jgi:hypothetical protein
MERLKQPQKSQHVTGFSFCETTPMWNMGVSAGFLSRSKLSFPELPKKGLGLRVWSILSGPSKPKGVMVARHEKV